jgi:hypothetical protein
MVVVWEISSLHISGKTVLIAVAVNFILNFHVPLLFPIELHSLGPSITFIVFVAILSWSLSCIMRFEHDDKNDNNDDNNYGHYHHRNNNGGSY